GTGEKTQDGTGGAFLRRRANRRLLQHCGRDRERRDGGRQVPQDAHPARRALLLGKVLLQAGKPRLSGLEHVGRPGRLADLLRPALPGTGAGAWPEGGGAGLQSVCHGQVALALSVGARADGPCGGERLLDRRHQSGRGGKTAQRGAVLRLELLLRPTRTDHRQGLRDGGRSPGVRSRPGHEPGGAQHLAVLARPPAGDLRRSGQGAAVKTLIRNGTVVTASDTAKTDVLIDGEKVAAIGNGLEVKADHTIDAEGRYVMPGAVDVHTHMELPFGGTFASDDFATGTAAAA